MTVATGFIYYLAFSSFSVNVIVSREDKNAFLRLLVDEVQNPSTRFSRQSHLVHPPATNWVLFCFSFQFFSPSSSVTNSADASLTINDIRAMVSLKAPRFLFFVI